MFSFFSRGVGVAGGGGGGLPIAPHTLRHDVHLEETGHRVHAVEDPEGQADVHDGRPHGELVEIRLGAVVELGPGAERRHDPQLQAGGGANNGQQHTTRFSGAGGRVCVCVSNGSAHGLS